MEKSPYKLLLNSHSGFIYVIRYFNYLKQCKKYISLYVDIFGWFNIRKNFANICTQLTYKPR